METFPASVNDQLPQLADLHKVYVDCSSPTESDPSATAPDRLGDNPTLKEVATWLGGRIDDVRRGQNVIAGTVVQNTKDIELHHRQITWLHQKSADKFQEVDNKLREVDATLAQLKLEKSKQYKLTCEMKQRSVKGNFFLSGPDVPKFSPGEHIFDIVARILWNKYQIGLDWYQMRAMHRLPGGNIILAVGNRMPGSAFQSLIAAVNSNPNPQIRAYLNLQLMEPFDMLHYTARKLISYYKLDENGYTWIALSDNMYSFKFTSLQQLEKVGVTLPAPLREELKTTNDRRLNQEREVEVKNLERASKERPVTASHRGAPSAVSGVKSAVYQNSAVPVNKPPVNGANALPLGARPPPPISSTAQSQPMAPNIQPGAQIGATHGGYVHQPPPSWPAPRSGYYSAPPPNQPPGSTRLSPRSFTEQYRFPENVHEKRTRNFGREFDLIDNSIDMGFGLFD